MKPNIDLSDPTIRDAMAQLKEQYLNALNVNQIVENTVLPVLAVLPRKAHEKPHSKPEQIGSCVLVNIKDQYFIFSASHVFHGLHNQFFIGEGKGALCISPVGEMYFTGKSELGQIDKYDACVFHITSELSQSLKDIALTLDDMDVSPTADNRSVFIIAGFRVRRSNVKGSSFNSERDGFPTIEHSNDAYLRLNIDRRSHISVAYEDQTLIDGNWKIAPSPRGMSGGAIVKIGGTDVFDQTYRSSSPRQLLSAIIIERHKKKDEGRLIGTRVNIHLQMLVQNMPELFNI